MLTYLLDTNIVIYVMKRRPVEVLTLFNQNASRMAISSITLAELSVGPLAARTPAEAAARQRLLQQTEADFDPIPFDSAAARAFGSVAASLRRAGRKPAARAYDALIAAVAISEGLPLYTANVADFEHIDGLDVREVRRA